jgi:dsDNA-specific endonuclease/ATPase MutS2
VNEEQSSQNGQPAETDQQPAEFASIDDARRALEHANSEAAAFRHERNRLRDELAQLQRENETERQQAIREAVEHDRRERDSSHAATIAAYERQFASMAIQARAGGRFADPADAVRYLDVDRLLAEHDKRKRDQMLDKMLNDLLEAKPYLAHGKEPGPLVSQGGRSRPPGGRPRERNWLR